MEKEQKICFGHLGNGITVWTSCLEANVPEPRYKAHISPEREITYYQENTPKYFVDAVERLSQDNVIVGNYHNQFAFYPKNKPTKCCDTRFCGRVLICEEIFDGVKHLCTTTGQLVDEWQHIKNYDPNDQRPVYLVGNLKRNVHGQVYGHIFGYSFSRKVAEEAADAIRNWVSDCWRHRVVEECSQDYLIKSSVLDSMVNLDWDEE